MRAETTALIRAPWNTAQFIRKLFLTDPELSPVPPHEGQLWVTFDGAARGNPGPAAFGVALVVWTPVAVHLLAAVAKVVGYTTNPDAEFQGLLYALRTARQYTEYKNLTVIGDSQIILNALKRGKPPKNSRLRDHYDIAQGFRSRWVDITWRHHPRMKNRTADALANLALDHRTTILYNGDHDVPPEIRQHLLSDLDQAI